MPTSLRQTTGNLNVTELTNSEQSRRQDMCLLERPYSPNPTSDQGKPQVFLKRINTSRIEGRLFGMTDAAGDVLENWYFWFKKQ